jgi:PTS system mannose-specific IID component
VSGPGSAAEAAGTRPGPVLPLGTRTRILLRLMTVQGSWNYESMLGTGMGFAIEPALRLLPGGRGGGAYRAALARQSEYFNSHPYLAAIAAGALARAELEGIPPARISRFRTALCGPLGSLGDRLVWAGLLPTCSFAALGLYGLGASPLFAVASFLLCYNAVHIGLRIWGLAAGWSLGLSVAAALGSPVIVEGTAYIYRVGSLLAGLSLPLVVHRLAAGDSGTSYTVLLAALPLAALLILMKGRLRGWLVALGALTIYAIIAVVT